jgi:hypothetical protein
MFGYMSEDGNFLMDFFNIIFHVESSGDMNLIGAFERGIYFGREL